MEANPPTQSEDDPVNLASLIGNLDVARQEEITREVRRAEIMQKIADFSWYIAQKYHRTDTNDRMDFDDRPFQPPIIRDTANKTVVQGSVQYGKTELMIVRAFVMAAIGLRVMYIFDKAEKRDKVVASRMDPALSTIDIYKQWVSDAKKKGRMSESLRIKHIGDGMINFVGANSPNDFYTYPADAVVVDEHQLCDLENVHKAQGRMSGSRYRYNFIVGNPRFVGSEDNQNLDWEYQQTDQRRWQVPCDYCKTYQFIDWWSHVVKEERNANGAILSIGWRDEEWSERSAFDLRPVCMSCHMPMNRVHRAGRYAATNPGAQDHGFTFSNIYNINQPLRVMYQMYRAALHSPAKMQVFWNDQLGLPFRSDGDSITDRMLARVANCEFNDIDPYIFAPQNALIWRK